MKNRRTDRAVAALMVGVMLSFGAPLARAQEDDTVVQARTAFVQGTNLVKTAQWAEALAMFERAAKLRPHAITTFNIGACERALGHYTRASKTLRRALAENEAAGGAQLSEDVVSDAKAYLSQIDALLASVTVTLDPASASLAVDGRPLEGNGTAAGLPVLVAGLRAPGAGETPPAARFKLLLDPGVHVLTLSRKGYADTVVNKSFAPGSATELALSLDKLPATLHIACDQSGAIVVVNGADVGIAPVDVSRPAGNYRVAVKKPGHVTYETEVSAHAGESIDLKTTLPLEKRSITSQWWFWTAAGVALSGVAVGTYFLARKDPEPVRPAPNGGGLGWVIPVQ